MLTQQSDFSARPSHGSARSTETPRRAWKKGLEETLTVIRLGLTGDLRRFFSSTNAIESMFSRVRQVTGRVKRWQGGDMRHRWCVSGLIRAEDGFRKIRGFKELPTLFEALTRLALDNSDNSRSDQ